MLNDLDSYLDSSANSWQVNFYHAITDIIKFMSAL